MWWTRKSSKKNKDIGVPEPPPITHDGQKYVLGLIAADMDATYRGNHSLLGVSSAVEQVFADLIVRDAYGRAKYGISLRTDDGRDTITDAYQEILDGIQYIRKAMEETPSQPWIVPVYKLLWEIACVVAYEYHKDDRA